MRVEQPKTTEEVDALIREGLREAMPLIIAEAERRATQKPQKPKGMRDWLKAVSEWFGPRPVDVYRCPSCQKVVCTVFHNTTRLEVWALEEMSAPVLGQQKAKTREHEHYCRRCIKHSAKRRKNVDGVGNRRCSNARRHISCVDNFCLCCRAFCVASPKTDQCGTQEDSCDPVEIYRFGKEAVEKQNAASNTDNNVPFGFEETGQHSGNLFVDSLHNRLFGYQAPIHLKTLIRRPTIGSIENV